MLPFKLLWGYDLFGSFLVGRGFSCLCSFGPAMRFRDFRMEMAQKIPVMLRAISEISKTIKRIVIRMPANSASFSSWSICSKKCIMALLSSIKQFHS